MVLVAVSFSLCADTLYKLTSVFNLLEIWSTFVRLVCCLLQHPAAVPCGSSFGSLHYTMIIGQYLHAAVVAMMSMQGLKWGLSQAGWSLY